MIIRKGIKKDIPQVLDLIKELAKYENSIEKISDTVERIKRNGFRGTPIFDFVINFAKEKKCSGLDLQVLGCNTIGINFYKKYNMKFDNKWTNCYLEFDKS